jgi:hypothetical protein
VIREQFRRHRAGLPAADPGHFKYLSTGVFKTLENFPANFQTPDERITQSSAHFCRYRVGLRMFREIAKVEATRQILNPHYILGFTPDLRELLGPSAPEGIGL